MQLELELQPHRKHALLLSSSPEAAWQHAIRGWFEQAAAEAWQSEHPAIVLVPTRGQIQALKGRLLEAGFAVLGLEFVTPPYLRALLAIPAERQLYDYTQSVLQNNGLIGRAGRDIFHGGNLPFKHVI